MDSVINKTLPDAPEALPGWDSWTGFGIEKDRAYRDPEYLQAKALWQKKKKQIIDRRSDGGLKHVILSDEISKPSSKYLSKWQPDWVNVGLYKEKMKDTIGREWNLSTEFFHTIKPDHDIPQGYIVTPTEKYDEEQDDMRHKTQFGNKKNGNKKQNGHNKLQSIYNSNNLINKPRHFVDARPERAKV